MFSFIDFKDEVTELALHEESKMIIFTSRLFILLSDDNSPGSASFSSSKFFLKFYTKWTFFV